MNKAVNSFRLFLSIFSGEDDYIIRRCPVGIQVSFALIGLFVILIFIGCFFSAYEFSSSLFEGKLYVSIPVGIVWAMMVTNMYLLLLYTVCPQILPTKENPEKPIHSFFSASMFFRISFITLLAIIIAQPLNVKLLSSTVSSSLNKHIVEEKVKMIIVSDSILIKKEVELFNDFNRYLISKASNDEREKAIQNLLSIDKKVKEDTAFMKQSKSLLDTLQKMDSKVWLSKKEKTSKDSIVSTLRALVDYEIASDHQFVSEIDHIQIKNRSFQEEFEKCQMGLKKAVQDKIDNYNNLDYLLSKTNFFIKRIQLLLSENPYTWVINFTIVLLFLLPIYFKYKVRDKTMFYEKKKKIEHQIVEDEYLAFKNVYAHLLQKNISNYNFRSLRELNSSLEKLKKVNLKKHKALKKEIQEEYKEEIISKYEYWADSPYRTKRREIQSIKNTELNLLELIYGSKNQNKT